MQRSKRKSEGNSVVPRIPGVTERQHRDARLPRPPPRWRLPHLLIQAPRAGAKAIVGGHCFDDLAAIGVEHQAARLLLLLRGRRWRRPVGWRQWGGSGLF